MNLIKKEIRTHCTLRHNNIIKLYNYDYKNNKVFLILEYAEKGNLYKYLQGKKLSEINKKNIFKKTCEAVAFMHANNLIHRDIKPENILLDKNLDPKLCDFGWSAKVQKNEIRATFCGTYEYMAPEVFESEDYNENIDVWSLGILLYEIFHGSSPFFGKSAFKIYKNIVAGNICFKKNLDPMVIDLILKILKINPNERPSVYDILEHPFMKSLENKFLNTNFFSDKISINKKSKKNKESYEIFSNESFIIKEKNINKNRDFSKEYGSLKDGFESKDTQNKNLRNKSINIKKEFFYKNTENKNSRNKIKSIKKEKKNFTEINKIGIMKDMKKKFIKSDELKNSFDNIKLTNVKKFTDKKRKKNSLGNLDKLITKHQNKIEKKLRILKNNSNSELLSFLQGKNFHLENSKKINKKINEKIKKKNKINYFSSKLVKKLSSTKIKKISVKNIDKKKIDFYLMNKKKKRKKKVNLIKKFFLSNSNMLGKKFDICRPYTSQNEKSKLFERINFRKIHLKKISIKDLKSNLEPKLKKSKILEIKDNFYKKIEEKLKDKKNNEYLKKCDNSMYGKSMYKTNDHKLGDYRNKFHQKKKNNLIKKNLRSKKIKVKEKKLINIKNKKIVFSSSDLIKKKRISQSIFHDTYGKFFDKKKIQKNFPLI